MVLYATAGGIAMDDLPVMTMGDGTEWNGCNHSTYWSASPRCPACRGMYGNFPESPAFQGSWLEKKLHRALRWLRRRR